MLASTPLNNLHENPPGSFKNSDEVFQWISSYINLEKSSSKRIYTLDNMKLLSEMAGHPEKCAPAIHVAGSKGKGSVTGMIAAILEASGIKTARYCSPHVLDFRERLSLGNAFFEEETYTHTGNELLELVKKLKPENREKITFFELFTLWFFLCASYSRCEAMAVETGMGGRLDATNILDPLVSVITLIELEHTEYLGNSISAIAGEKAGIIKAGRPLVLAEQSRDALEVFKKAVREVSPGEGQMLYFPDCCEVQETRIRAEGTSFSLVLKAPIAPADLDTKVSGKASPGNETKLKLFIPIPGEVYAKNAGLAILACKTAFHVQEEQIREALANFTLPARFERISVKPLIVIDGAHTKNSLDACLQTFTALYGYNGILVFGCAAGKDISAMAELCIYCFSRIIITRPGTFKESRPAEIYDIFTQKAKMPPIQKVKKLLKNQEISPPEVFFIQDTGEAVEQALNYALETGLPILGAGSFYLAGEIKKQISSR